jgi:hypothetical protein
MDTSINRRNVGRIAERIVANELEFRGFRVGDLNKEGISANADLIAVKDGEPRQTQVKGASNLFDRAAPKPTLRRPNRNLTPFFNSLVRKAG